MQWNSEKTLKDAYFVVVVADQLEVRGPDSADLSFVPSSLNVLVTIPYWLLYRQHEEILTG